MGAAPAAADAGSHGRGRERAGRVTRVSASKIHDDDYPKVKTRHQWQLKIFIYLYH